MRKDRVIVNLIEQGVNMSSLTVNQLAIRNDNESKKVSLVK